MRPVRAESFALVLAAISAKDSPHVGNPAHPVPRVLGLAVILLVVLGSGAHAEPCPPTATLEGDAELVRAVRDELGSRGIASATPRCPAPRFRVDRRGAMVVVGMDGPGGAPIERVVSEPAIAATVIESWTRSDVTAPLLEAHPIAPRDERAEPAIVAVAPPAPHGVQLFAAQETSLASDDTVWAGMQLGACIMLGPVCASLRLHGGKVVAWPARTAGFERVGGELYVGLDVPIAVGRDRLTLGFAAGYGQMFTRRDGAGEHTGVELGGPRAELHAAFAVPVTAHIALDLTASGSLNQVTRTENHLGMLDPAIMFPGEPRAFVRLALGLRYGAL